VLDEHRDRSVHPVRAGPVRCSAADAAHEPAVHRPPGGAAACYDEFRLARTGPVPDVSWYRAKHGPEGCDPGKWEQALLDYLGSLGPVADYTLRDAIARWWEANGEPTSEGFAAEGPRIAE
jgi:hypothetical protein